MDASPDLSRLTPAEREVLALLAQGHTAKSIAATLDCSEGSVNERLREARRKTGVGSSRELARLAFAQKSPDEKIGVVINPAPAPAPARAPLRVRWQGTSIMIILLAAIAAAAALLAPVQQAVPDRDDATFAAADGNPGSTPWELHDKLAHEPRADKWASSNEAALRMRYAAVRGVDAVSLRVRCGTSVCEVLGRAMATIQSHVFRDALKHAELENVSSGFGSKSNGGIVFLAFWTRQVG